MRDSIEIGELAIVARGVRKSFGNFEVLRNVNLEIKKGEFFTLFGPNGAGKTTLVKILSTLTKPSSGVLEINGFNAKKRADDVRRSIGFISHDPYLYDNLNAYENIKFFLSMYGIACSEERAVSLIGQVGLENRRYDLVRTFSRGMKQRLAVARAMVNNPSVLLLDEPYAGLDHHGAEVFRGMLERLKYEGKTILMTTHRIEEGIELSNRVGILANGRIIYDAANDKIDKKGFKEIYALKVGYSNAL